MATVPAYANAIAFFPGRDSYSKSINAAGNVGWTIVGSEQHFYRTSSAYEARQARHRAAAWNQAGPDLPLRQDGFFPTRKPHIAGERELAPDTGSASAN